jgi:hypothetical protein
LVGAVLEINPDDEPIDKLDKWFTTDSQLIEYVLGKFDNVQIFLGQDEIDIYEDDEFTTGLPFENYTAILKTTNNDEIVETLAIIIYSSIIGNRLYVPAVTVGKDIYQAELIKKSETSFELDHSKLIPLKKNDIHNSVQYVDYDGTGVDIPMLDIPEKPITSARLKLIDPKKPMQFDLKY